MEQKVEMMNKLTSSRNLFTTAAGVCLAAALAALLPSCGKVRAKSDSPVAETVGVTNVARKSLQRQITLSSELVPFQEIDVYAKESGFVKKLYVDYGSRVQAGQLMATLEIPELEAQLQVDQSAIQNGMDEVSRAQHQLKRYQAHVHRTPPRIFPLAWRLREPARLGGPAGSG